MSLMVFKEEGYCFFFFFCEEIRMYVYIYCEKGEVKFWFEFEIELVKNYKLFWLELKIIEKIIEVR